MIMQQHQVQHQPPAQEQLSNEELCNLLVQSLIAKDEKSLLKVLERDEELVIKDIINRIPVNHVSKLVTELRNVLSNNLTSNHLRWLQHLLTLKYSVITTMADGRSALLPFVSLLNDRSSPDYYNKLQGLKGKLAMLSALKEAKRSEQAETVVRVQVEPEEQTRMELDSETDTDSDGDFDGNNEDELDENLAEEPQADFQHEVDDDEEDDDDDEDVAEDDLEADPEEDGIDENFDEE